MGKLWNCLAGQQAKDAARETQESLGDSEGLAALADSWVPAVEPPLPGGHLEDSAVRSPPRSSTMGGTVEQDGWPG